MSDLLSEVSRSHFPNPPATPEHIAEFEARVGWRLDPDMRAFYLHCDGAKLFDTTDSDYHFLPLAMIRRARVVMSQSDSDKAGPVSWYVACALQDSNYIIVDVGQQQSGRYPIIDGYREGFPDPYYCAQIAPSFSDFLERALHSEGRWFWLRDQ
ncbi:SMI1/KNR4 family protein [Myxococcaceae bacterium JPH2]|nr:SMI1/KNR4 family protein [Myxococcaceae bacterium JPH2]